MLDKPAFKNAIKRRRCLIPADGYYEWQDRERPQAAVLHPSPRRPAGRLCRAGGNLDGAERRGDSTRVAIVTAPASRDLAALHHRVPVTIAPDDFERWLDGRADDADDVMPLLRGPAEGEFAWHEISTRVNRVANDDAQLLLPITDEERGGGGAEAEESRAAQGDGGGGG